MRFRAFLAWEDDAYHEPLAVTFGPVPVEKTLVLRKNASVRVRLLDRGTPIPLDPSLGIEFSNAGGDSWTSCNCDAGSVTIHVRCGGRYTLRLPALEGYVPIAPRTVDVRSGELVEVDIPLIRD